MAGIVSTAPDVSTIETDLAAVLAKTQNLPDDPASESGAIKTDTAAVKVQTDKLAGEAAASASVTANWQSGTGTSGETGADLVSLGSAGDRKKLHSLIVDISALTATAVITIKLFLSVNGTSRKVYSETFTVGTDADGCWVVNGTLEIANALRVECQSNNAADNGLAIAYEYDLEDM